MSISFKPQEPSVTTDYENYSIVALSYDDTRVPIGLEIILGCFAATDNRPLHEQVILDAGCGTGNYIEALHHKVGRCYGIDVSQKMVHQARKKFAPPTNVRLDHGSLLCLPYPDQLFDGVMCNQVVHHLDDPHTADGFQNLQAMVSETHRVLRTNGVLVINMCSRRQLFEGYWWADLIPQAVDHMARRMPSIELTIRILGKVGFNVRGTIVPLHAILQGPSYLDPKGPLSEKFRNGDSTWSLLKEEELKRVLEHIQTMNEDGSIESYLKEREERRKGVGQTTFLFARKK